jgi:hypothetical protein
MAMQPTKLQHPAEVRRSWLVTILENIAAGAGVTLMIWAIWDPMLAPHYRIGYIVAGGLCALRFGIDEIALLFQVLARSFAAAFADTRNRLDTGRFLTEIHRLRAENEKLRQRIIEWQASQIKEVRPTPPPITFTRTDIEGWRERQAQVTAEIQEIAAPPRELDASILALVEDVNALLNHFEVYGNLSKPSAEKSKIYARQWNRAIGLLVDAKAVRKGANGYELIGTVADAQCAIDAYLNTVRTQIGSGPVENFMQ